MTQEILTELSQRCQCSVETSQITTAGFSCFEQSPNAVTFRARITGTQQVSAQQFVNFLEDWIASGAFLSVQAQFLTADESCAISIASLGETECQPESPAKETTESPIGGNFFREIVIGSVLGVLLLLVAAIAVVVTVLLLSKRHKKGKVDLQAVSPSQE